MVCPRNETLQQTYGSPDHLTCHAILFLTPTFTPNLLYKPTNGKRNDHRQRKCAENYNKLQSQFILKLQSAFLVISNHNSFRALFDKIASVYLVENRDIYILALEMASPGNQHCVNCIGTLSFPISRTVYAVSTSATTDIIVSDMMASRTWAS